MRITIEQIEDALSRDWSIDFTREYASTKHDAEMIAVVVVRKFITSCDGIGGFYRVKRPLASADIAAMTDEEKYEAHKQIPKSQTLCPPDDGREYTD